MLLKGFRSDGSRPASRAASRATGESRSAASANRASGPHRYEPRSTSREWRAFDHSTCSSTKWSSYSATGMSSPRFETTRPRSIGYSPGCVERHELVVLLVVGEVEPGGDPDGLEGDLARPLELGHERRQLALAGRAVPAAHLDVDRMHLAAADDGHELVSDLLHLERARDDVGRVAGQLDRARVAEEVGGMEHEDVQGVALDPLPAVQEPAQRAQLAVDLDAAGLLHRVHRAHLVGDRADAADPGGDVGRLGEAAPAQERLEEPGRLVDVELHLLDLAGRRCARTSPPRPRRGPGRRCGSSSSSACSPGAGLLERARR